MGFALGAVESYALLFSFRICSSVINCMIFFYVETREGVAQRRNGWETRPKVRDHVALRIGRRPEDCLFLTVRFFPRLISADRQL